MEIPNGITITIDGTLVKAIGPKGEVEKCFETLESKIIINRNQVEVESNNKAIKGTIESHLRNMMFGVQYGYIKRLKLIYAHFPFTLEVKGDTLTIKNLLGEKLQRTSKIIGKTKIDVKEQEVTISGLDKEAIGQTTANFKRALHIKRKDCRVFQDGAYEIV